MSELKNYINNSYKNLKLYQSFWKVNKNTIALDLKNDINTSISQDAKALELVYLRALDIFNDLFNEEDDILFVVNKYDQYEYDIIQNEDGSYDCKYLYDKPTYTQEHIRINPYIQNKSILRKMNCVCTDLGKTSEVGIKKVHNFYISCKVKDIRYKILIRELIEDEIINHFKGMADYYIVHKEKGYVYHLCNDEWIDLSFNKNTDFKKFKEKYSKYLCE